MWAAKNIREQAAANLRAERARLGWTQAKTAEAAGISVSSLKAYESGKRDIPFTVAVKLADVYAVSLDYLAVR